MDTTKSPQASNSSNSATTRRRTNVRIVQNVLLVWLDNSTDRHTEGYQNTMTQLRRVVNTIDIFTDDVQCIDFLTHVTDEKVIMIISDALCQDMVPLIHNIVQLHAIFIFCRNEKQCEPWAKEWPKIRGVFTEIQPICIAIKGAAQQCEQNAISISFVPTSGDLLNKRLDQLDCSFMYTQILKEILLTIIFQQQHIKEFIDYCYKQFANNDHEFNEVKKFEQKYSDKTPIWWYTCESFLYPMLNRALRLMDADIIIKMGFFIGDLHRHIEKLYSEQLSGHCISEIFTLYRGQGLPKTHFDQMMNTKDGLISFNNFLSTSKDRDVSFAFAESNAGNPDLVGILFVITIDPLISSTPFASIKDFSYFNEENEILFSMHTVFRICDIKPIREVNHLYQVNLTLANNTDQDLRVLTDRIREETFPDSIGWNRLGQLLIKLGQFEKAQQVYEVLLGQPKNENDKAHIYVQLGRAKNHQGQYDEAITFYEKSLEIYKKTLLPNHPDLGIVYSNISSVYCNMGEYSKALWSDEKALEIRQQSLPPNHPDLASSYNNIGNVYDDMGEYSKALWSYEKALEIQQQSLPPNHPDLASSYNNIGNVYDDMCEYPKALWSYEKALEIRQQSLPPNHPDLAASYNNIGLAYDNMDEYSKALSFHEKAVEIKQQSLPPNHPDLAFSYNNIGLVYYDMGECSKALSSHEKALEIRQQSLPSNHPLLAFSYNNIGFVYKNMGEYSKALSYYEKALKIRRHSLPPNHRDSAWTYNNIGNAYNKMHHYFRALSFHEKALEIRQQSLPVNHPDFAHSYENIGKVYENLGDYSKAASFYEHAVDIGQRSLPSNNRNLEKWRKNLDRIKEKLIPTCVFGKNEMFQ